jgi:mannose-6-phosphate isomerase-like protein (cupin superfamily)
MMSEQRKEIAARLKEMRRLRDETETTLAAALRVSLPEYQAFEAGATDIPASMLHDAAQFLRVDLTELLTGETPRLKVFTVTRKGAGVSVERRKDYKYQNLAANFQGRKADIFEVTVPAETARIGASPNTHPGQEFNYLLEGRMRVRIHGQELILEPGDCVYFDSNYGHSMEALDGQCARFLAIIL